MTERTVEASRKNLEGLARLIREGRLPRIAIASADRNDGAGAQAMARISAMIAARYAGCPYLHAPFKRIQHGDGAPGERGDLWEQFLGLGRGETSLPAGIATESLQRVVDQPEMFRDQATVIRQTYYHLPRKLLSPMLDAVRPDLRRRYWTVDKSHLPSHGSAPEITIAVHLRRGDVTASNIFAHRYVPDEAALASIRRLQDALAPLRRPFRINLYSQGDPAAFSGFAGIGCRLHLDGDPFETLHNMITADILLCGRSKFSLLAGLLSRGIVIPSDPRSLALGGWQRRKGDGRISMRRLQLAVLEKRPAADRIVPWIRCKWQMLQRRLSMPG
jgi:hypothetical protein